MFKRKNTIEIHMADLRDEQQNLSEFLLNNYKINSTTISEGLQLNVDEIPTYSLVRMVTKFLHQKNLSNRYWASAESNAVKINRFEHQKRTRENKHPVSPSIIKHGF